MTGIPHPPSAGSLAAIVVHYRTPDRLLSCLAALADQSAPIADILVVDNSCGVSDAPPPARGAPWRLERAAQNLGYGAACNLGASHTSSEFLLFLNADLVLDAHACEELRGAAETSHRVAVIGPRILGADGEIELSARRFPSPLTGVLGRSSLLTRAARARGRAPRALSAAVGESNRLVDWVSGACMLVHRRAFEDVGGFDEAYWMYWEDADLCRRLRSAGWRSLLCVDAVARHSTGSSGRSARTVEAFHASAARYYRLHLSRTWIDAWLADFLLSMRSRIMLATRRRHHG